MAVDRSSGKVGKRGQQVKTTMWKVGLAALVCCAPPPIMEDAAAADGFDVVVLGALGGIQDGNLSAYLVRPHDDDRAVTCDAGTLVNGLRIADSNGAFDAVDVPRQAGQSRVGYILTHKVKGYLISHAHLDHVAGLVIASPDDSNKPIYALPSVGKALVENYFNWQAWPNFTDRGKPPRLGKLAIADLEPAVRTPLSDTKMTATAFPLSHGGLESTAFLFESDGDAMLCFGDTGPDAVEKTTRMKDVWTAVAGKVKQRRLKAVVIEASYANDRPDKLLFGHLTPKWLLASLHDLAAQAGAESLTGLPVVVGHIKYSLTDEQPQKEILDELEAGNDLGLRFILPRQGSHWHFK
ncbi:3',5'-cyclic-nucleotide phosphodiesterase [Enhydrobacter sp.]|jgi:3',5'-cyclic-nucleotide phosphodiesterase|uniref:MBL fold metallo-hydrolase n=1 Tax=Enhydrobacter sp. TaxID=1894999 RepID=UPI0026056FA0|nr:3',5'-cyclic-nucleotide phosphodiesterase [Enhydrobacter sp.]WIM12337.1 MAG: 3',5'-cyclic-nucleotide phosphodiesterase [Enhydrobacter sp.]